MLNDVLDEAESKYIKLVNLTHAAAKRICAEGVDLMRELDSTVLRMEHRRGVNKAESQRIRSDRGGDPEI